MKKNSKILKAALFVSLTWGALSCTTYLEEEVPISSLNPRVEIVNGTLKVDSFDHYEDLITGKEKLEKLSFINFQDNFRELLNSGKNLRINQVGYEGITSWEGSPLLEILDKDGFVILEDYLIYLNFNNRSAVVTKNLELKEDILDGNISSEEIRLFSFDDDVIGLLEQNSPSTLPKTQYNARVLTVFNPLAYTVTAGCDGNKCDNSNDSDNINIEGIAYAGGNFTYRLEAKHVYQAAAISFRLLSQAKHMRRPSGSFLTWNSEATAIYLWYDFEYLSKKSGSSLVKSASQNSVFSNILESTFYSSGRGLEKFYLKSQFYGEPGGNHGYAPNGAFWQFNLKKIEDGY
jgi:hypothetical protein